MAITRVTYQNFQTHKKRVLVLTPGVNVLVGRTDVGKSSLLRGLRWLCLNQPRGDGFVRWGKSGVGVGCEVGGRTVVRVRKGKHGYYEVDGKRFDALNGTVPRDVQDLLRTADVNFQRQIDPPFWFTLTPGKVAQEFNRVVDLSLIDQALDRIGRSVRAKRTETALVERRYKEAKAKAAELSWTVQYQKDKSNLDQLDLERKEASTRASRLAQLVRMVSEGRDGLSRREKQYALGVRMTEIGDRLGEVVTRRKRLGSVLKKIKGCSVGPLPDFTSLQKVREVGDAAAERRRIVEHLVSELKAKETALWEAEQHLASREAELLKLTKNTCPTCGRSPWSPPTYTSPTARRRAARSGGPSGSRSSGDTWPN